MVSMTSAASRIRSVFFTAQFQQLAILPYMVKRQFRIKRAGKGK